MSAVLQADGIDAAFGKRRVLDRVSCRFDGGWTAVVGPNGAGKSTLLRIVAGLMTPAAGRVTLDGMPIADLAPRERGRRIAWMAQSGEAPGDLDVRETVALGRLPHVGLFGATGPADDAAVDLAMTATGCDAWAHRDLAGLSGGERQRVLLARVLATEATTLLLDEPTTHLDPTHQIAIVRMARRLAATHTVVTVLHDLGLAMHADRVMLMDHGRVRVHAPHDDPALHAAMIDVFAGAIRIRSGLDGDGGRAIVLPRLD